MKHHYYISQDFVTIFFGPQQRDYLLALMIDPVALIIELRIDISVKRRASKLENGVLK